MIFQTGSHLPWMVSCFPCDFDSCFSCCWLPDWFCLKQWYWISWFAGHPHFQTSNPLQALDWNTVNKNLHLNVVGYCPALAGQDPHSHGLTVQDCLHSFEWAPPHLRLCSLHEPSATNAWTERWHSLHLQEPSEVAKILLLCCLKDFRDFLFSKLDPSLVQKKTQIMYENWTHVFFNVYFPDGKCWK